MLPMCRPWVQPLVGELKSSELYDTTKQEKERWCWCQWVWSDNHLMTKTEQCIWQHGDHSELGEEGSIGKHGGKVNQCLWEKLEGKKWRWWVKDSSLHTFYWLSRCKFLWYMMVIYIKISSKKIIPPSHSSSFISHFMSYVFQYIPNSYPNPAGWKDRCGSFYCRKYRNSIVEKTKGMFIRNVGSFRFISMLRHS